MSQTIQETKKKEQHYELDNYYMRRIIDTIKPLYKVHTADQIASNLALLLHYKNITKDSIIKLIATLSEETRIETTSDLINKVNSIIDTPKKPEEDIVKEALVSALQNALVIIKSLEEEEARDQAIRIVETIESYINTNKYITSPLISTYRGSGQYFVNDPKRGILLQQIRKTNNHTEIRRYIITSWYIRYVQEYKTQLAHYFKVVFQSTQTNEILQVTGTIEDIVQRLKRSYGIKNNRLLFEAISSLIPEFKRRGLARSVNTPEAAGIYFDNNDNLILVKDAIISKLILPENNPEKAKQALLKLAFLRGFYDFKKFDIAINWLPYAIISYALKERFNIKQYQLTLYGERHTGKTTLARILRNMFKVVDAQLGSVVEEADTEYRLGYILNLSTFPQLIDEAEIFNVQAIIKLLKRASTSVVARWRGDTNKVFYARSPIILTCNPHTGQPLSLTDPGLLERFIIITFTYKDYVYRHPANLLNQFKKALNEYFMLAPYLGRFIIETILKHSKEIKELAYTIHEKEDVIRVGKYLWRIVCKELGIGACPWTETDISLEEFEYNINEQEKQMLLETIIDIIKEAAHRVREDITSNPLPELLKTLYEKGALPSFIYVKKDHITVTAGILREIHHRYNYRIKDGLSHLAPRLGYEYGSDRIGRTTIKGMKIPISELESIFPSYIETENA